MKKKNNKKNKELMTLKNKESGFHEFMSDLYHLSRELEDIVIDGHMFDNGQTVSLSHDSKKILLNIIKNISTIREKNDVLFNF